MKVKILISLMIFVLVFIASILFHKLINYNVYPILRSIILGLGGALMYYKIKK
jgi:hypothetical protein